jgi:serine/threonine protein kinase
MPVADSADQQRRSRKEKRFNSGSPEEPVRFGKYDLMGRIARGGMAEIYRAKAATTPASQLLAVKCMRLHLAKENRFVEMFIREGKLAMMLQHDGIVRTFDVGSVDGRYFITMEHINGKDLNGVLRRCQEIGRRVPVPHAIFIALNVCHALHYAHRLRNARGEQLSIVNRDVSPSNIRISYEGNVKLLDFGIAQALLQVSSEIGILKGKFSYMSPEQVRGLPLDHRTDIFSTGIVLHEMLTCERLFRDESEFVLMEKVRRAEVKAPSTFNKRVPAELDRIVMKALSREASARFPDCASMAAELEDLLTGYQFSPAELGEFVRGIFPNDYRKDQQVEAACLSPESVKEVQQAPQRPEEAPKPPRRQSQPELRGAVEKESRPQRRRGWLIWFIAVGLLLAALVILMVALL